MMIVSTDPHTSAATSPIPQEQHGVFASLLQLAPHAIEWYVEDATFVIRGCVTSYYHKQLATTVARRLPGVERIVNELEVRPCGPRTVTPCNDAN